MKAGSAHHLSPMREYMRPWKLLTLAAGIVLLVYGPCGVLWVYRGSLRELIADAAGTHWRAAVMTTREFLPRTRPEARVRPDAARAAIGSDCE
jgi:hypothetical protein